MSGKKLQRIVGNNHTSRENAERTHNHKFKLWISAVCHVEIHNVSISLDIYKYNRRLLYYVPFRPCIYDHRTKILVGLKKSFLEVETHHIGFFSTLIFNILVWVSLCAHIIFLKLKFHSSWIKYYFSVNLKTILWTVSNFSFINAVNLFFWDSKIILFKSRRFNTYSYNDPSHC